MRNFRGWVEKFSGGLRNFRGVMKFSMLKDFRGGGGLKNFFFFFCGGGYGNFRGGVDIFSRGPVEIFFFWGGGYRNFWGGGYGNFRGGWG